MSRNTLPRDGCIHCRPDRVCVYHRDDDVLDGLAGGARGDRYEGSPQSTGTSEADAWVRIAADNATDANARVEALQRRNRDLERRVRRVIHAAHERTADHVRGLLRTAMTEVENRRLRAHAWTPDETKNRCTICGDGPWGRHRFQGETV